MRNVNLGPADPLRTALDKVIANMEHIGRTATNVTPSLVPRYEPPSDKFSHLAMRGDRSAPQVRQTVDIIIPKTAAFEALAWDFGEYTKAIVNCNKTELLQVVRDMAEMLREK